MLCLSCHDGNVTNNNMMTNQLYEQKVGLLTNPAYGSNPIPTLLGNHGTTRGNYYNDHPMGTNAVISDSQSNGLTWTGTKFTVTAGSNYDKLFSITGIPRWLPAAISATSTAQVSRM